MIVRIEDFSAWLEQKRIWNQTPIDEIEFTRNGVKIEPRLFWNNGEEMTVEDFKFTGLSTVDYLAQVFEGLIDVSAKPCQEYWDDEEDCYDDE